jgi:hypothetical protein
MKNYSVLALAMVVLWISAATNAKYSGGTGEPNDPYRITIAEDLNDVGNHQEDWDKHFILVNDVNLAEYTGTQFKIIGRWIWYDDPNNKPFAGVFDGNEHKVWNFTWVSNGRNGVGLFAYLGSGGQIKNLGMENVDVNAVNVWSVGGLVGYNRGTITTCYSTGSVSGDRTVGGMVGWNDYFGTISGCYFTGNISGKDGVGGLMGRNDGLITNCYSTGSASGGDWGAGGLVGNNNGTITTCYSACTVLGNQSVGGIAGSSVYGKINACYSTGSVTGTGGVGGLVGSIAKSVIIDCYSTGSVSGNYYVGGLVGSEEGVAVNSFWDVENSGQLASVSGTGKTTAEMKTRSTFTNAGWDFIEIWGIGENQTYPFLLTDPAGDSNHDKKVDFSDLAILASHWLEEK